jgi:colanic acid biosynthesis glycosyl transferase WcaI
MRIQILGINHAPELIGIGVYTSELASFLASQGNDVTVVTGKPYYPDWRVFEAYRRFGYIKSTEDGVRILRCPIYVPKRCNGIRRIIHHMSFALSAAIPMLIKAKRQPPDLIISVAPSLLSSPVARLAARLSGAKSWLHIQDFEVEAAFATALLPREHWLGRLALAFERAALPGYDRYSSISPQMCAKLRQMTNPDARIVEFRNWSNTDDIFSAVSSSPYRREWNVKEKNVALYSGNIANKQGIDIIVAAAKLLRDRTDLLFVICGEGPNKDKLIEQAAGLPNIRFEPLQPRQRLQDLLSLATVHLLPQLDSAADLVLPSKLTNILASGRPVVATARPGSGLASEVEGCGILTPPEQAQSFADAIVRLISDNALYSKVARAARERAEERWSKATILDRIQSEMRLCVGEAPPATTGTDIGIARREASSGRAA